MNKIFCSLLFLCCWPLCVTEASAADNYYISPVAFVVNSPDRETLSFPMEKAAAYKRFTLNNPARLVIDFPQGIYQGKKMRKIAESSFITAIRSARHLQPSPKTRIVIDLRPGKRVQHQLFFDKGKKALQLILTGENTGLAAVEEEIQAAVEEENIELAEQEKALEPQKPAPEQLPVMEKEEDMEEGVTENVSAVIHAISFEGPRIRKTREERVRFRLNGFHPPKISTREETLPEVVCDFAGAELAENIDRQLETGGNLVQRITAKETEAGVRVILELTRGKDFDLQQIFFRDGNFFVVVVREFVAQKRGE